MAEIHSRKSHDYANNSNPYGNYHFAGNVAALFSHSPHDAGFAGRLAEKMYRLSVLESSGKAPKNESIDDTERDIAVIATLWMASRQDKRPVATKATEYKEEGIPLEYTVANEPNQGPQPGREYKGRVPSSEDACCQMIQLDTFLTPTDRQQMIDYLKACQRDAQAKPKDSTDDAKTFTLLRDIGKMINDYLQQSV